jgi:diaminohydroxyphosphoribosylaminopyrimidine deaminase/5-amino-6-(5-phosphoribosylamino)uracil reductase
MEHYIDDKNNSNFTEEDKKYMELAIKLAENGRGRTNPNPMVGTVITKNGRIISSGYHKQAGLPHAEIEAINNSSGPLENSTMYVTLEPCTFHGKTPPCVNEIVKYKFKEIIIGCIDPNPKVNGRGIRLIKKAGIKTRIGLLKEKIKLQNEVFFKHIKTEMPFVCCKIASSIDGKTAARTSDSRWITSEKSRMQVQHLRDEYGCTLTGINTVLADDPYLFPRKTLEDSLSLKKDHNSQKFYRVVLDSSLRINLDSNIMKTSDTAKTIIFTTKKQLKTAHDKITKLYKNKIDVLGVDREAGKISGLDILKVLRILYKKYYITSLLLECGPTLVTSFLKRDLIDKFIFYIAPKIIGGDSNYNMFRGLGIDRVTDCINLKCENIRRNGGDIVITAYPLKE